MWQGRMCHLPAVAFGLIHSCGSSLGKGDPREGGANRRKASQCKSPLWLYGDFVALLPLQQGQVFSPAPPPREIRDEVTMLTLNHEKTSKWGRGVRSATETVRDLSGPDPSVCQMIAEMDCNERRRESCSVCPCM